MRTIGPTCVIVGMLLVLSAPLASGSGTGEGEELGVRLETRAPVHLDAALAATDGTGVLVTWNEAATVRLEAERVTVWMETWEGERITLPTGDQTWREHNQGETRTGFHNAVVTAHAWRAPGQLLLEPTDRAEVATTSASSAALTTIEDEVLAWAGLGKARAVADESAAPIYEARIDEALTHLSHADTAQASGNFTLFVNNVTLTIQHSNGPTWRNWTGFRSSPITGSGTSMVPAERYELRITRLVVEDGTLALEAPNAVSLLGPSLAIESEGLMRASNAEGWVNSPSETLWLSNDELVLAGHAHTTAQPGSIPGSHRADRLVGQAPLALTTQGDLELIHTTGERRAVLHTPDEGLPPAWMVPLFIGAVMAGAGTLAVQRPAVLRPLPDRWTKPLYDRWENAGLEHEQTRRFPKAIRLYKRLVALDPEQPMGWFLLARARLDAGEPDAAIRTVDEAEATLPETPLDLFEIKVDALAHKRAWSQIGPLLDKIADKDPPVARGLVVDLGLEHVVQDRDADWWLERPSRGQGLDGYV